jgi:hypothetical protein
MKRSTIFSRFRCKPEQIPQGSFLLRCERFPADASLELVLDRDLVTSLVCACGESKPIHRARAAVKLSEAVCPACQQTMMPQMQHAIAPGSELASQLLYQLGVPEYDIVRVTDGNQELYFALDGDRDAVMMSSSVPLAADR